MKILENPKQKKKIPPLFNQLSSVKAERWCYTISKRKNKDKIYPQNLWCFFQFLFVHMYFVCFHHCKHNYILRTLTIDNFNLTCFLYCKMETETHTAVMRLRQYLVFWGKTFFLNIISSCVKQVKIHILNWTFIPARILRSGSSNVQNNFHKPWTCKARYK